MNFIITVIRWFPVPVVFAAAPPAPPTCLDIPLSLAEAGMGTHYIQVTVASR